MKRRRAFTLVELLVVAGIFAMLFSVLLVGRRSGSADQMRVAVRSLTTELVRAQSRALESSFGSSLIAEPDAIETANVLAEAVMRSPPPGTASLVVVSPTAAALQQPLQDDGYRIQFFRAGSKVSPWFRFTPPDQISLRADAGQTPNNTIWPDTAGGAYGFSLLPFPERVGKHVTLPKNVAIDLRFSGCGNDPYAPFGSLRNAGSIAICFNTAGQVDGVVRNLGASQLRDEVEPNADVFFLLAPRDAITNRAALARPEAFWVVLKPSTGRVITAANVPQVVNEQWLASTQPNQQQQLRLALLNARGKALAGTNMR